MSRTTLMFKVYQGESLVKSQRFDAEVVKLGSLPSSDLRLEDAAVARQHAVIEVNRGEVKLIDLGSPAGTLLNGLKISKFATLKDGDVMTLGNTRIEAQISNTHAVAAPAAVAVKTSAQPQLDAREFEVQNGSRVAQVITWGIVSPDLSLANIVGAVPRVAICTAISGGAGKCAVCSIELCCLRTG